MSSNLGDFNSAGWWTYWWHCYLGSNSRHGAVMRELRLFTLHVYRYIMDVGRTAACQLCIHATPSWKFKSNNYCLYTSAIITLHVFFEPLCERTFNFNHDHWRQVQPLQHVCQREISVPYIILKWARIAYICTRQRSCKPTQQKQLFIPARFEQNVKMSGKGVISCYEDLAVAYIFIQKYPTRVIARQPWIKALNQGQRGHFACHCHEFIRHWSKSLIRTIISGINYTTCLELKAKAVSVYTVFKHAVRLIRPTICLFVVFRTLSLISIHASAWPHNIGLQSCILFHFCVRRKFLSVVHASVCLLISCMILIIGLIPLNNHGKSFRRLYLEPKSASLVYVGQISSVIW